MRRALRLAAALEAATYLVLLAAVAQHRLLDGPDRVSAVGLVHGLVFLGYAAVVLAGRRERRWSRQDVASLLAAAFVPLGTVVVERRLRVRRFPAGGAG